MILTEITPNPDTLKFLPGRTVLEKGTADFRTIDEAAETSPLAEALFNIEHVKGVFFGIDFISITKTAQAHWDTLKPYILTTIMEHYTQKAPLFFPGKEPKAHEAASKPVTDTPIEREIRELLDTRIRPAVAQDGGDITFDRFEDGIVYLQMRGACAGCPSSTMTLKSGIENMLRHYVPEVQEVRQVNEY